VTANIRNLEWLRSVKVDGHPDFGARLFEALSDTKGYLNTLEQQGNFNLQGIPPAPTPPDNLKVVSHPQGVQFSITHLADFSQGVGYEIDCTSNRVTHTYDVGNARNGVLPVGPLAAQYQVRARYPTGVSTPAVRYAKTVVGGKGSSALLPSQGAGTTKPGQPPGFGGPNTISPAPALRSISGRGGVLGGGSGGGSGGITQLIGDVLAGPGVAKQTATVVGINGLALPIASGYVGTNGNGQIVPAASPSGSTPVGGEVVALVSGVWTLAHAPISGYIPLLLVRVPGAGGYPLFYNPPSGQPGFTISGMAITLMNLSFSPGAGDLLAWYVHS